LSARFSRGHLQVTLPSEAKYALRLIDTRGRLVESFSVEGKSEIQLPVSNLRPGINLLEARSVQGSWHTVVAGIQGR
jgi:hypothetical protein